MSFHWLERDGFLSRLVALRIERFQNLDPVGDYEGAHCGPAVYWVLGDKMMCDLPFKLVSRKARFTPRGGRITDIPVSLSGLANGVGALSMACSWTPTCRFSTPALHL